VIDVYATVVEFDPGTARLEVVEADPGVFHEGEVVEVRFTSQTRWSWTAYEGTPQREKGDIRPGDSVAATLRPSASEPQWYVAETFSVGIGP
jgi:hypothetical protein